MVENDLEELLAAACAVEEQALDNPGVGIPVDPDVADFMGAMEDPGGEESPSPEEEEGDA